MMKVSSEEGGVVLKAAVQQYVNEVTGVEEITPEQSSLSMTTSLKLFITRCTTAISA